MDSKALFNAVFINPETVVCSTRVDVDYLANKINSKDVFTSKIYITIAGQSLRTTKNDLQHLLFRF